MSITILIQILIFVQSFQQSEQVYDWKFMTNKNDIKAYTRKVEHSKYLEYKIEAYMSSTVHEAIELLSDITYYKKIFPYISKAELVHDNYPNSYDVLVIIDAPFPARDRIGVYTNQLSIVEEDRAEILISHSNKLIPDSKYVPVEKCYGSWNLKKINEEKIFVSHTFFADPGGSIPAWIINAFALKQPIKTFSIIRNTLESRDRIK